MSFLALLMGAVLSGSTVIEYGKQPLDEGLIDRNINPVIQHAGFSFEDTKQLMVQYAYKMGGLDFVIMIECESGFNPNARGDNGHAYGLCQMNDRWHKIPNKYLNDWKYQIEYCYEKWKGGTKFYGPDRIINGIKCKKYVLDRFIIHNEK